MEILCLASSLAHPTKLSLEKDMNFKVVGSQLQNHDKETTVGVDKSANSTHLQRFTESVFLKDAQLSQQYCQLSFNYQTTFCTQLFEDNQLYLLQKIKVTEKKGSHCFKLNAA